jgi:pimeloyl-ACP methyl ester carboxylesterase
MKYFVVRLAESSKRSAVRILAALLFAVLAFGCDIQASAAVPDDGRTIVVDGHRVAIRVVGRGRPAIVLISGLGDGMATFQAIARDLGKTHTVLVYDRAGYGGSDPGRGPRDASAAERELSGVLSQSGVAAPFVLLGHSLGGLFAEYYAAKHPDQVSGLILEDSRPADFTRRCAIALGASQCLPPAWSTWLMPKGGRDEVASLEQVTTQVEGSAPLRGKPVLVLSRAAAKTSPFGALWTQAQEDLAARYPGSRHLTAEARGHYIHRDQRDWFLVSVRAFLNEVE